MEERQAIIKSTCNLFMLFKMQRDHEVFWRQTQVIMLHRASHFLLCLENGIRLM